MLSLLIIFVCSGLLVYWMARVYLLVHGSDAAIEATLESDWWWYRKLLSRLCMME